MVPAGDGKKDTQEETWLLKGFVAAAPPVWQRLRNLTSSWMTTSDRSVATELSRSHTLKKKTRKKTQPPEAKPSSYYKFLIENP